MLTKAAAIFLSSIIGAIALFQSPAGAFAKDGYRLCAPRKGVCKCQKRGDAPGVWTIMDTARCNPKPAPAKKMKNTSPPFAAGKNTLNAKPRGLSKAKPKRTKEAKRLQKRYPFPALSLNEPNLKNCRVRKGRCTCEIIGSEPTKYTAVARNQCKNTQMAKSANKSANKALRVAQEKLNHLGYEAGTANGIAQPETTNAIKEFQVSIGVLADGKITPALSKRINGMASEEISLPIHDNTPTPIPELATTPRRDPHIFAKKKTAKSLPLAVSTKSVRKTTAPLIASKARPRKPSPRTLYRSSNKRTAKIPNLAKTRMPTVKAKAKAKTKQKPAAVTSLTNATPASAGLSSAQKPQNTTPVTGLLGFFKADTKLPNSMDGYKNCALRKGKCLCQKRSDEPGVWTTMRQEVCTRRTKNNDLDLRHASPKTNIVTKAAIPANIKTTPQKSARQTTTKNSRVSPKTTASLQKPIPSTQAFVAVKTSQKSKTSAGLLGFFKANSDLPNSMVGYKNCALRKGKCLCQKRSAQPGVWTTMKHEVCTRRSTNIGAVSKITSKTTKVDTQKAIKPATTKSAQNIPPQTISKIGNIGPVTTASLPKGVPGAQVKTPLKAKPKPQKRSGLFRLFEGNSELPNSMVGYRNCALRKGKCLCQKKGNHPGVWTIMRNEVCTRRSTNTSMNDVNPEHSGKKTKATKPKTVSSKSKKSTQFIESIANTLQQK